MQPSTYFKKLLLNSQVALFTINLLKNQFSANKCQFFLTWNCSIMYFIVSSTGIVVNNYLTWYDNASSLSPCKDRIEDNVFGIFFISLMHEILPPGRLGEGNLSGLRGPWHFFKVYLLIPSYIFQSSIMISKIHCLYKVNHNLKLP